MLRRLVEMPRRRKRAVMVLADAAMVPACLAFALLLRYESLGALRTLSPWAFVLAAPACILCFQCGGLYRAVTRYIDFRVLVAALLGALAAAGSLWLLIGVERASALTSAVAVIFAVNVLVWVAGSRLLVGWLVANVAQGREPVVIYGVGETGAHLTMSLNSGSRMRVVAYVDDKEALRGMTVNGARVVEPARLPEIAREYGVRTVLLAVPGASRRRRSEIIRELAQYGVRVQTVPEIGEILSGRAAVDEVRDVSVNDLLGRDPVRPDVRLLGDSIHGQCVLVTGAGGSIGSELCRQILAQGPARLVLLELSELALYDIKRELDEHAAAQSPRPEVIALLGNACNRKRLAGAMRAFGVRTVYHAAAYKHVPIVEENVLDGVDNNVMATWHAAEAAVDAGVASFVLVSTDKAVNPTSVMGATKRFAEIILQALDARQRGTRFCMVRFGNVLASSGSVVPLFTQQIRAGGPVTVTHPEVRRYFMTIPEAASLVLQAEAMARGGEVFLLDMGQPVRIAELAERMIALSGLSLRTRDNQDGDIEIRYTGLRPGEKLFEELLIGENVAGTEHPMIMRALEHSPGWPDVEGWLLELRVAIEQLDCARTQQLLLRAVREYQPKDPLHDLVWRRDATRGESSVSLLRAVPPSSASR
ncbi:MAG: nucleoside-diphosphate sugar epimerase/dehydratase [Steroidobacteraceae bacterium]